MSQPHGPHLTQGQTQNLKQSQRLMMLPQMQQALALLQMPILELAASVELEMEQNPVLDDTEEPQTDLEAQEEEGPDTPPDAGFEAEVRFDETNFEILKHLDEEFRDHLTQDDFSQRQRTSEEDKRTSYLESIVCRSETLGEHLMQQARESFEQTEDLRVAEILIGYLDENGYLGTPLTEIALLHECSLSTLQGVLKEIQTFDPTGVGSTSLKDSLLLQLKRKGKRNTLALQIVQDHWEDLLHHRIPAISKALGHTNSEISHAIDCEIARLDFHPGSGFTREEGQAIVPDVSIRADGDALVVIVNDDPLPLFRFNWRYLRMLDDPTLPEETREFLKQKLGSAKWLCRTIEQRKSTLQRIAEALLKHQSDYFRHPEGQLKPLTMKRIAEDLGLHESTIARAVVNKYLYCPRGIVPLRAFFTNSYVTEGGVELSSDTVRDALEALIKRENKGKPLSDDALSRLLKTQGITCARRTIAKYRNELQIGNALQRRTYS